MLRTFMILSGLCLTLGSVSDLQADDWPQWRGALRDGVSRETGLLKNWPEGGPKQLWLCRDVGLGYSGMAVVGETLYTMGALDDAEHLIALSVTDGSIKWKTPIGKVLSNGWGDGPRGTPAVDGDRVYALSGPGDLICCRTSDGEPIWSASMTKDFGGRVPNWGYSESVLIDGEKVLCTPGGKQGAVVALDKKTGNVIWQSDQFQDLAHYASLVPADHGGVHQYIQLTSKHVVGLDAQNGHLLWSVEWPGRTAVIPTPIHHEGLVFVTSGYGVGCKLIELDSQNHAKEIYYEKTMKNHHGGVVRVGDHLYGYSDGVGWLCMEMRTGERIWNEKRELGKGTLACAGGMLYLQDERNGDIALIEASPNGFALHGKFRLSPQSEQRSPKGKIWTHPTVANGRLYLRDQELLFCFDIASGP